MEVILKDCDDHPICTHGPCLMFERQSTKGTKTGKRFYACSACRDRSSCPYFHWVDDPLPQLKKDRWEEIIKANKPKFSHEECLKRLIKIKNLDHERRYCKTCSSLILPTEKSHSKHDVIENVSSEQLLQPSLLFKTLDNKKAEAQYFFSDKTKDFVVSLLKENYNKFILIGLPKVHEHLISLQSTDSKLKTLLLDIDSRYMQFFGPDQFCHYNLFNNYFFGGKSVEKFFKKYLTEKEDEKIVVLIDPPFGGLIDAISFSLQKINKLWQTLNSKPSTENVPLLWFFPYFLESRIIKNMPDLVMMDYKVEYLNHKKFGTKAGFKGSPVRIFTNLSPSSFVLPKNDGYRFCKLCKRYVAEENKHCLKCKACTTKHGKTYRHCEDCQQCVKDSYIHCGVHNKCVPKPLDSQRSNKNGCPCSENSTDETNTEKCFKCFGYGHRKRDCPTNSSRKQKKKKYSGK